MDGVDESQTDLSLAGLGVGHSILTQTHMGICFFSFFFFFWGGGHRFGTHDVGLPGDLIMPV